MEKLIKASTVIEGIESAKSIFKMMEAAHEYELFDNFGRFINNLPDESKEEVHAHWIRTGVKNVYGGIQIKCSRCGHKLMSSPGHVEDEFYCCYCGAKMDGAESNVGTK